MYILGLSIFFGLVIINYNEMIFNCIVHPFKYTDGRIDNQLLFILILNLLLAQAIPKYVSTIQDMINTKYQTFNEIVIVFLSSGIFIGGFIGFILDNTIPGIGHLYYGVFILNMHRKYPWSRRIWTIRERPQVRMRAQNLFKPTYKDQVVKRHHGDIM